MRAIGWTKREQENDVESQTNEIAFAGCMDGMLDCKT